MTDTPQAKEAVEALAPDPVMDEAALVADLHVWADAADERDRRAYAYAIGEPRPDGDVSMVATTLRQAAAHITAQSQALVEAREALDDAFIRGFNAAKAAAEAMAHDEAAVATYTEATAPDACDDLAKSIRSLDAHEAARSLRP